VLHLVLKFHHEPSCDLADRSLGELLDGCPLSLPVYLLQLLLEHGRPDLERLGERPLERLLRRLLRPLALRLANVGPGGLDVRDRALVDGVHVGARQVVKHVTAQLLTVHHLSFHSVYYLSSKLHELFNKFGSKVLNGNFFKRLQIFFFGQGADHSAAIALFEEGFEHAADAVLLFNAIREAFLWLQSFF